MLGCGPSHHAAGAMIWPVLQTRRKSTAVVSGAGSSHSRGPGWDALIVEPSEHRPPISGTIVPGWCPCATSAVLPSARCPSVRTLLVLCCWFVPILHPVGTLPQDRRTTLAKVSTLLIKVAGPPTPSRRVAAVVLGVRDFAFDRVVSGPFPLRRHSPSPDPQLHLNFKAESNQLWTQQAWRWAAAQSPRAGLDARVYFGRGL